MLTCFDFVDAFHAAWERHFLQLPHPRQIEVMVNAGGYEWRQLAAAAAKEAEDLTHRPPNQKPKDENHD